MLQDVLPLFLCTIAPATLLVIVFNLIALFKKTWSRQNEGRLLLLYLFLIPVTFTAIYGFIEREQAHEKALQDQYSRNESVRNAF